jgi:tRNA threonylcarbamoyladenosine biosynthesis protein TsaE
LFHFDFYRFTRPEEYLDAGLDEYFAGKGVCLIEWPHNAAPYLPPADITVALAVADTIANAGRSVVITAHSDKGNACLTSLQTTSF